MAICEGRYTKPSELAPNLSAAVDLWFTCVLAVDRDDRFDSAGEAVASLRRALGIESEVREREVRKKLASLPSIERGVSDPRSVDELGLDRASNDRTSMSAPTSRFLDVAIAVLVGFTALCVGALLASMDGF
jgi:hypothetical protein